jgi:hypothetical protein
MATLDLYVNSFDASSDAWDKYGASPYLDAQDGTNYVEDDDRNNVCGDFGFQTTSETGTINSVTLYLYAYGTATSDFEALLNTSSTGLGPPAGSWQWVSVDVSGILTDWTAINSALLTLDRSNNTNWAGVDAAYLHVDYVGAEVEVYITHQ